MQNLYCKGDWFNMVCESYSKDHCKYKGQNMPRFPDENTQINTTGQAGCDTLCEAYIFYEDCINRFEGSKNFNNRDKIILDFGTGWGRVLRFFLKDFEPENMIGVDINNDLLNICRSTFDFGTFIKSNAMPKLEIEDTSVDYIVGYSVFSHLSEDACSAWMEEFSRIVRPGGMVALTTRGRWFLDYCRDMKNVPGYQNALSNMFDDFEEAKARYDHGKLLHSNSKGLSGGGVLNSSFYGETFIPEEYARKEYSKYFEVQKFEFSVGRSSHPTMFFLKH